MTQQVWLIKYGMWSDIVLESREFLLARDADGVNVYVIKDGNQRVREVK